MTEKKPSKADLRGDLLKRRQELPFDFANTSRWKVWNHLRTLIAEYDPGVIAFYQPVHGEVDLSFLADEMRNQGRVVALPRAVQRGFPLVFNIWDKNQSLDFDVLNMPCGNGSEVMPNMVILPLLGFRRDGYRLGYGGGFYDMTLPDLHPKSVKIGVAYAFQEVPELPVDDHDALMDYIVTEEEVILCQK